MPLVTRQVNQANLFKQDEEPTSVWANGDLWSDTDDNEVFVNNNGTADQIGASFAEIIAFG